VNPDPIPTAAPEKAAVPEAPALAPRLGLFDITMLVMGSVIGAGIFVVPHTVAALVPAPAPVLAAWVIGGLISMAGGLVYADLARRRPHVGGQYAFLREAYHPALAFVYGWSLLWVIQSGGMAAVALVFGTYCNQLLLHLGDVAAPGSEALTAALAIAAVTVVNCTGARAGSTAQNVFMSLKILAILTLVLCGLLAADARWPVHGGHEAPGDWLPPTAFAAALVQVFFAYGGWHTTTFLAAEVRDPTRTLPRGLVLGVTGVIVLYLGVSIACLRVLGAEELAVNTSPAAAVMRRALGTPGALLLSAAVAVSALGFVSQASLTSPRVYYAMARDGLFFRSVAWVHPRTRSPVVAVLLQGTFALALAVTRTFQEIINSVMCVEMTFFALTALGLFVIRRRDGLAPGPACRAVPGHPVTTLLFAAVNIALVLDLLYREPANSAAVAAIALAGLPAYCLWSWRSRSVGTEPATTGGDGSAQGPPPSQPGL
jgi:APA family basic amino acid/polyamine antiporter